MARKGLLTDRQRLWERCAKAHPNISVDSAELTGAPHIRGTRLTVCCILERLYVHESISAVAEYYADVSTEQIKEAISYAAAFLQMGCEPKRELSNRDDSNR